MKTLIVTVVITLLGLAGLAIAQAAKPAAGGPTKVTGASTKTASGLEYWTLKWAPARLDRWTARQSRLHGLADQRQEVRQFSGYGETV